jgi:hypothetical protein
MARKLHNALPGGNNPLCSAVWECLRPMLSPTLVELNRAALVADEEQVSTVGSFRPHRRIQRRGARAGRAERSALELAPNARREISREGTERPPACRCEPANSSRASGTDPSRPSPAPSATRCLPLAAQRFGTRVAIRIGRFTLAAASELGSNDRAAIDRNLPAVSHGRQDRPDRGELATPGDGDSPATHRGPRSAPSKVREAV